MVDVTSHLRDSGFSDDEISAWATTTREHLKGAGFSDDEVDGYLGMPKTPKGIPAAFVDRLTTGAKFAAQISSIPKAYSAAWQYGQSIGQEAGQETVDALKGVAKAFNPVSEERRAATERTAKTTQPQGLFDEGMQQTGSGLLAIMSLPFAPLTGALHAIAGSPIVAADHTLREGGAWLHGEEKLQEAEKSAGTTPGGLTKEEANKIIDTAVMGLGNRPVQRIAMGPGGVPEVTPIGGLPKGEDFSNASTAIGRGDTTPAMEAKLLDLYEQKGIHPAEVAHDAQTDVTITQSILSVDKQDMPVAYHGSPHDFDRFDVSKIGTGEGAQSFGHGLYFAENEGVAKSYQDMEKRKLAWTSPDNAFMDAPSGNMYQVRINADREHFLDWDKPIKEQSEFVRSKLGDRSETGAQYYEKMTAGRKGSEIDFSNAHSNMGIPGIKYLDQGSRTAKPAVTYDPIEKTWSVEGDKTTRNIATRAEADAIAEQQARAQTRNFVVFSDKDVEITHKNGEPVTGPERQRVVDDILNERQPSSAGPSPVERRTNANGEFYQITTEGTGTHRFEPSNSGVYGRYEPEEGGRPSATVMTEAGEWREAMDTVAAGNEADPARVKWIPPDKETADFVAHTSAMSKDLNISNASAAKLDDVVKRVVKGELSVEDASSAVREALGDSARDILNERQPSSGSAAAVQPPAYSDAVKQVLSKISIDEKAPTSKLTWDKLYTNTMDKLFPIAKAVKRAGEELPAEENPYQLARLMAGSAGKADHFLNNGTFDFATYENNGKSLKEILAPVKGDLNEFRAYIASARALELEGRGIKSGFDAGEVPSAPPLISAGLDAPRTAVIEGRERFAKPFLELVDYQNRVAAYARDAGVISEDGYKAMVQANQLYVPFTRVMGIEDSKYGLRGGSSMQASNPVKEIKGSARSIIDPLESIIRNTHHMIEMAERNVVGTKLVDMLKRAEGEMPELPAATEDLPVKDTPRAAAIADELASVGVKNPDELAAALDHASAPLREGEIAILRDGKRETYKVDPELANAMKSLDAQSMALWDRVMAIPASWLRTGSVLTPQFWARHVMRDYLYATATSTPERGLFTPWDMAKGFGGLIAGKFFPESRFAVDYWNWMKSGGSNIATASMDRQYLQENLRKLTGETGLVGRAWNVLADPEASMWQKTGEVGMLPFKAIQKFLLDPLSTGTQIAEEMSHLAAFKKGMRASERAEPEATNLRDQIIRAGWASRDTAVDAARMGASMRAYNQVFAFGNIKLQDTDRVVRAFKDNPITATALITGAITVPSVILWSLNHDDPDYQELPQWEKDFFFIVPVGTAAPSPLHEAQAQARGEAPKPSAAMFLRLPKPWAMGMVFGSGVERMLEAYKGHNPEPFREFGKDLWATSGPDFVPTAAAPIIDQFANRSTFTNRTLIPQSQEKFLPEYQYTPYTTELTKSLGQMIGAFPGMSQLKMDNSGFGGTAKALTSPILMENYIRGWTGTLGMYALQAADKSLRAAGVLPDPPKPASTLADIPVIQAFVVRYPSATTESVQKFQDDYEQAKSYMTTWQAMAKDGNVAAMQHIQDMADTRMLEQLDGFHQTIANLNQMVRLIYKNPDIPPDEKRQLIDQTYFGIIQTARGGNQAIHAIREKAADVVSKQH